MSCVLLNSGKTVLNKDGVLKWLKSYQRRYQRQRLKSYHYKDVNYYAAKEEAIKQIIWDLKH